jgi:hypothetical protein
MVAGMTKTIILGKLKNLRECVFIAMRDGTVTTAFYEVGGYFKCNIDYPIATNDRYKNVTHWMTYPEHPVKK